MNLLYKQFYLGKWENAYKCAHFFKNNQRKKKLGPNVISYIQEENVDSNNMLNFLNLLTALQLQENILVSRKYIP